MPSLRMKIIGGRWEVKFRPAVLTPYKVTDVRRSCNLHKGKLQIYKLKKKEKTLKTSTKMAAKG